MIAESGARVDDPIVTLDEGRREGKIVSDKTCDGKSYQSREGYKTSWDSAVYELFSLVTLSSQPERSYKHV